MRRKKNKKQQEAGKAEDPQADYNKTITITTLADLEERDRKLTRNMTHKERMEYLQQLNENLYGNDLKEQINILSEGRIITKRAK